MAPLPDFRPVRDLMAAAIADGVFPGAVLCVQAGRDVLLDAAWGVSDLRTGRPVTTETVFDLASLTKPLATTLAVMLLLQAGRLRLASELGALLPDVRGDEKATVTVRQLLCHTAGLPAHRPYYQQVMSVPSAGRKAALNRLLVREPPAYPVGTAMVYSDPGFMLLRWVVETVSGTALDRFVSDAVYRPLRIASLYFPSGAGKAENVAAVQYCPWRRRIVAGEVGDENAAAVGGVDGHAGLFGTAKAVGLLLAELSAAHRGAPNRGVFQRLWLERFFVRDPTGGRALGFDMPTPGASASGGLFSPLTVGHLGYTGTSFWWDLARDVGVVLLSNRVHPDPKNDKIRAFRPLLHDAVMTALDKNSGKFLLS